MCLSDMYVLEHLHVVGSGSLSIKTACILGSICEFLGALLLGQPVFKTLRDGMSLICNGLISCLIHWIDIVHA